MSSVSPTHQDLSNYTTFSQIKSRVPVPLKPYLLGKNIWFSPAWERSRGWVERRERWTLVRGVGLLTVTLTHAIGSIWNKAVWIHQSEPVLQRDSSFLTKGRHFFNTGLVPILFKWWKFVSLTNKKLLSLYKKRAAYNYSWTNVWF